MLYKNKELMLFFQLVKQDLQYKQPKLLLLLSTLDLNYHFLFLLVMY